MTEHTLRTFTQTQHPVFLSMYRLQYNRGTVKLLGKRGNIFPNSENTIILSQSLIKHEFTLKILCSSLFQTGDIHRSPQCDCILVDWFQFVDFNVLWDRKLFHHECPISSFQIVLPHGLQRFSVNTQTESSCFVCHLWFKSLTLCDSQSATFKQWIVLPPSFSKVFLKRENLN